MFEPFAADCPGLGLVASDRVRRKRRQQQFLLGAMDRRIRGNRRRGHHWRPPFANGDTAARGEMLGIEGDGAHVLVPRNEIYTHVPIGMGNRTFLLQLVPDRIGIEPQTRAICRELWDGA